MNEKVKKIYEAYVSKGLIDPEKVSLESFALIGEDKIKQVHKAGVQNGLLSVSYDQFKNVFDGSKKKEDSQFSDTRSQLQKDKDSFQQISNVRPDLTFRSPEQVSQEAGSIVDPSIGSVMSLDEGIYAENKRRKENDNYVTYLKNQFLQGWGSMVSGEGSLGTDLLVEILGAENSIGPEQYKKLQDQGLSDAEIKDWAKKYAKSEKGLDLEKVRTSQKELLGDDQSEEYVRQQQESFLRRSVGGVASSIPAMLGNKYSRAVNFGMQAMDMVNEEMAKDKDFKDVTENEKYLVTAPIAVVNGILEEMGLQNIARGATKSITLEVLKRIGKKKVTQETLEVVTREVAKNYGKRVLSATEKEFFTGASQQAAELTIKNIYDWAKENEMFDATDGVLDTFQKILTSGLEEAVGGFLLGGAASANKGNLTGDIYKKISKYAKDEKSVAYAKSEINKRFEEGDITENERDWNLQRLNNLVSELKQVENLDVSDSNKALIVNLLGQRKELEEKIKGVDETLSKGQRDRINEINLSIEELSTPSRQKYSIDGKEMSKEEFDKKISETDTETLKKTDITVENDSESEALVASKFEQVEETEVIAEEEPTDTTTINDAVESSNQVVVTRLGGSKLDIPIKGDMYVDGQQVVVEDNEGKIYELGNVDEISRKTLSELGVEYDTAVVNANSDGTLGINGKNYSIQEELPTQGLVFDEDGNIVEASVKDENGKPVMFKGDTAVDIGYQILLNKATSPEQEARVNEELRQDEEFNKLLEIINPAPAAPAVAEEATSEDTQQDTKQTESEGGLRVFIAPFYDTTIDDVSDAKSLRKSKGYKKHISVINNIAKAMGLDIVSIDEGIGGFENEQGTKIREIQNVVRFKPGTSLDLIEQYAAILGASTTETQEASIAARYVSKDSKEFSGDNGVLEFSIKIDKSKGNEVLKALKDNGILDFTYNENTGELTFLDFSKGNDLDFNKRIYNFAEYLKNKKIKHEKPVKRAIESRYIDPQRRKELLSDIARTAVQRGQNRGEFYKAVKEAIKRSEKFLNQEAEIKKAEELFPKVKEQAKRALVALSKIAPKVKIIVHDTPSEYAQALGTENTTSRGAYDPRTKTIHINAQNAVETTVPHEVFHAILLSMNIPNLRGVTKSMIKSVYKVANPELKEYLDGFSANYDQYIQSEEKLAELVGVLAAGYPSLPLTGKSAIRQWLDKLAKAIGLKPFTDDEAIQLLNTLAQNIKEGREVSKEDISPLSDLEKIDIIENLETRKQSVVLKNREETLEDFGLKGKKSYTVREIGEALDRRTKKIYGKITDTSEKSRKKISKYMVEELVFELTTKDANSAVGWYTDKFQRAIDILAKSTPSLMEKNNRDVFTMFMAVTSDGQKVSKNFELALKAYKEWETKGKVNVETFRSGDRTKSIQGNLKRINELLATKPIEEVVNDLLIEKTVGELKKENKNFKSNYLVNERVPKAAGIFGEKLGAFYANLSGSTGYLTMDRWWSRTFNRYRGTLVPTVSGLANDPVDSKGRLKGLARFKEMIGQPNITDKKALSIAKKEAEQYKSNKYKNGTAIQKAANTIYKSAFVELNDIPFNASDRSFMIQATKDAQKQLKEEYGYDMSIADMQAVLWYFEKRLYKELGGKDSKDISYEEVAKETSAKEGLEIEGPNGETVVSGSSEFEAVDTALDIAIRQQLPFEEADKKYRDLKKIQEDGERELQSKKKKKDAKYYNELAREKILDRQARIKNLIKRIGTSEAGKAMSRLITKAGGSGYASFRFKEASKKIFDGLKDSDLKILDRIIYARRIVAINENRETRGMKAYTGADGFNQDDANYNLKRIEMEVGSEVFSDLSKRADEYFKEFNKTLLRLKQANIISEETYTQLKDVEYSPIKTIKYLVPEDYDIAAIDRMALITGVGRNVIMELSDENANNIITDSKWLLMSNISMAEARIFENRMLNAFADAINSADGDTRKAIEEHILPNPSIGQYSTGKTKYKYDIAKVPVGFTKISYTKNGQKKYLVVNSTYASQLLDMKAEPGFYDKALKFTGTGILRFFATSGNPLFIVGNTAVDFTNILFLSDVYSNNKLVGGAQLAYDSLSVFLRKIAGSESYLKEYEEFMMHGGSVDYLSVDGLNSLDKLKPKSKALETTKKALKSYAQYMSYLGESSEIAFRLAVYNKSKENQLKKFSKENGKNAVPTKEQMEDIMFEAAREARETIDFSQGGSAIKSLDKALPYLNAATQGFRKASDYAIQNPSGFALSMVQLAAFSGGLASMSMMLLLAGSDDDEEVKRTLDSISDYEKANYHIIFTGFKDDNGEHIYVRIKKLPTTEVFSNLAEYLAQKAILEHRGIDYDMGYGVMTKSIENIAPITPTFKNIISRNPLLSGIVTYQFNYDLFYDKPVFTEPVGKEILPEAEGTYDDKVDEVYKRFAPPLGLSPKRTKAFFEKIITSESTNPTIGLAYSGIDAALKNDETFGKEMMETGRRLLKSTSKKLVRSTNKNLIRYKKQAEAQEQKMILETDRYKKEQKVYNEIRKRYKDEGGTMKYGEFYDLIKNTFDPIDHKRYAKKYLTYIKNMNADKTILDMLYETDPKVQALMMFNKFGNSLEGDELKELAKVYKTSGRKLSKKAIYYYRKEYLGK